MLEPPFIQPVVVEAAPLCSSPVSGSDSHRPLHHAQQGIIMTRLLLGGQHTGSTNKGVTRSA